MGQRDGARLAMSCWDYAWPLGLDGRAAAGTLERRLDETLARGFNAVRLDPFPHLLATPGNGIHLDRCELLVDADRRRDIPVTAATVEIRRSFKRLLLAARERGLKLWLTGFFIPDSRARRSFVRRPGDFVDVWAETLDLARRWGALDTVVAVDFCHHFPFPPESHGAIRRIFGRAPQRALPEPWSRPEEQAVERYLVEVPRALRALFPDIRFGVSASAGQCEYLRQLDTSELDFLDLSLWLDDDPRFRLASGADLPVPGPLRRFADPLRRALMETTGDHWSGRVQHQLTQRLAFARIRRMEPVLGEGYLSLARVPETLPAAWAGFIEEVVFKALEEGVGAMTPTSLARPHTGWLWREASWLADLNRMILAELAPATTPSR